MLFKKSFLLRKFYRTKQKNNKVYTSLLQKIFGCIVHLVSFKENIIISERNLICDVEKKTENKNFVIYAYTSEERAQCTVGFLEEKCL